MLFRFLKDIPRWHRLEYVSIRGTGKLVPQNLIPATNQLDHTCRLQYDSKIPYTRLTSIICSIGPASNSVEVLEKMIENGMQIARLNFIHATYEELCHTVVNLRRAADIYSKKLGYRHEVAIAMDTTRDGIRTGWILSNESDPKILLKKGQEFRLSINKDLECQGNKDIIYVDYPKILKILKPGNEIFLNDSAISLEVKELQDDQVICVVKYGGYLMSHSEIDLPGVNIELPILTDKTKKDLKFGIEQDIDLVFAGYIRNAGDVEEIRTTLGDSGKHLKIIPKIENLCGLKNTEEIIDASDGILVARGTLGLIMPLEKVFLAQKSIIARCNKVGKPVICATDMLRSMMKNPRPTRAEISDVANAIFDGADCVMLIEETSIGAHPVECVKVMAKVCSLAESAIWHHHVFNELVASSIRYKIDESHFVVIATVDAALKSNASAIVIVSVTGLSAFRMSKYRPSCPIIAIMPTVPLMRQSLMYRGILPLVYEDEDTNTETNWLESIDNRVNFGIKVGHSKGFIQNGDPIVIVTSWRPGSRAVCSMRIITANVED